jgi:hypothetical protein
MRLRGAITTIDELRDLLGTPRELAVRKPLDRLYSSNQWLVFSQS